MGNFYSFLRIFSRALLTKFWRISVGFHTVLLASLLMLVLSMRCKYFLHRFKIVYFLVTFELVSKSPKRFLKILPSGFFQSIKKLGKILLLNAC
jgi:hypothetical protein